MYYIYYVLHISNHYNLSLGLGGEGPAEVDDDVHNDINF